MNLRHFLQITLVGQIVNLQVQSTNVELEVDDGTGKIGVRMWLDVEEENQSSRKWEYVPASPFPQSLAG